MVTLLVRTVAIIVVAITDMVMLMLMRMLQAIIVNTLRALVQVVAQAPVHQALVHRVLHQGRVHRLAQVALQENKLTSLNTLTAFVARASKRQ